jgi:hypothetical protein
MVEDDILEHKWDKCQGNFVLETGACTFNIIPEENWVIRAGKLSKIIFCGSLNDAIDWALAHRADYDATVTNVKDGDQNASIRSSGAVWRHVK